MVFDVVECTHSGRHASEFSLRPTVPRGRRCLSVEGGSADFHSKLTGLRLSGGRPGRFDSCLGDDGHAGGAHQQQRGEPDGEDAQTEERPAQDALHIPL